MRELIVKKRNNITDLSSAVEYLEKKYLIFNRNYVDLFEYFGLDCFDSIWEYQGGEVIKRIKTRSVIRIEVQNRDEKRCFYLKRHNLEYVGLRRVLSFFFPRWIFSQGRREFENICAFRKNNLATVVPVIAGEKFFRFFWARSFLITEDFCPFISLEALLRDYSRFFTGEEGETKKGILMQEIALFARKMHKKGFNHRDFNATHILLHYETGSDIPEIALFDLQRVTRRKFFKFRWPIKNFAELNYSLPDKLFGTKDIIYLLLCYKGKNKLHFWDRLQLSWINRKTARIKRHTEKMLVNSHP
ncbi:MAG: lipopolysaccharide kinase InaA family protein [Desulfatiglandales bacterium]